MDDPASFCHEVVHKKHIFLLLQALPLKDEGCVQGNQAGTSLHTQEAQCWSWNK